MKTNEPFEPEGHVQAFELQQLIYEQLAEFDETVITNFYDEGDSETGEYIIQMFTFDDEGDRYGGELVLSKGVSDGEIDILGRRIEDLMRAVEEQLEKDE